MQSADLTTGTAACCKPLRINAADYNLNRLNLMI